MLHGSKARSMHEPFGGGEHLEHTELHNAGYQLDNVVLTTIGVDVGSSTYHVMFAKIHLCREASRLSSRYEVVSRKVIWRSTIGLTPYRGRRIDADVVGAFVSNCHELAGLTPNDIDSGAVILTGEALRKHNARPLAEQIAAGSGKFVCVSAGHHLEGMLAAYGSGATTYSKLSNEKILHLDIGGGTTKLTLIENGQVRASAASMIGGRQVAWDAQRKIVSTTAGASTIARFAGVDVTLGSIFTLEAERAFAEAQAQVIVAFVTQHASTLERELRLTRVLPKKYSADAISFSGGVSEYVYGRCTTTYGDLGCSLGSMIRRFFEGSTASVSIVDPGVGIRATVAGASQCSVQLSGNTVTISDPTVLPIYNVPVIHLGIHSSEGTGLYEPVEVGKAIMSALATIGSAGTDPVALALPWEGDPSYQRIASLAQGIQRAFRTSTNIPVLLLINSDIAASIGNLLITEFALPRPIICLDGLDLFPLDYVDVGVALEPSGAFPVVIKSLLFEANDHRLVAASS